MPRITEYNSQTDATAIPEVQGARIDEAGQMGRAVRQFGGQVTDIAEQKYHQQAQEESSDAQVEFATAREDFTQKINKGIQDGDVNTAGIREEYQKHVDDISDRYQTAHGRRIFNQEAARTGAMLTKNAMHAEAIVSGEKAKNNLIESRRADSTTIQTNPNMFMEIFNSNMAGIDSQVQSGAIPREIGERYKRETGTYLAKAAVEGWTKLSPDAAEALLKKGAFDDYLDAEEKHVAFRDIHTQRSANELDEVRKDRLEKKAQEKAAEDWKLKHLERLDKGELSAKEIIDSHMPYADKKEQLMMLEHSLKENARGNPATKMDLHQRIFLADGDPKKITDMSQIDAYAAQGLISISDRTSLVKEFASTTGNKNMVAQKKILLDFMRTNLIGADDMTSAKDPEGPQHMSNAVEALNAKEAQYRAEGKDVMELYKAGGKDSFYAEALQYKRSSKDVMKSRMDQMKAQSGAKSAVNNVPAALTATDAFPRLPGEDGMAWIARRKAAIANAAKAPHAQTAPTAATPTATAAPGVVAPAPAAPEALQTPGPVLDTVNPEQVEAVPAAPAEQPEDQSWWQKLDTSRLKDQKGGEFKFVQDQLEKARKESKERHDKNREAMKNK